LTAACLTNRIACLVTRRFLRRRPPLSSSVREAIAARISTGDLAAGARLPPEPDLAAELGVSRATLREALRTLEEEGMLTRVRGAGTFVTHRVGVHSSLDVNFGVTEAIRAAGMEAGSEGVSVAERGASPEEARRLALSSEESVVVVERVRTADGRPVVYSRDVIPARFVSGHRHELEDLGRRSLYELFDRDLGVAVHHGVALLRPIKADRTLATRLRVIRGALFLLMRQVDYDEFGRPVLYSHEYHLADAFEFAVVRRGSGVPGL